MGLDHAAGEFSGGVRVGVAVKVLAHDIDVLARTIYGEARGEPWAGKLAVGWVIKNRAAKQGWWGDTIARVCQKKAQFTCWTAGDPNYAKINNANLDDPVFRECFQAALTVVRDGEVDPTKGGTHYYADSIPAPAWAAELTPTVEIGHHKFFR